MQGGKDDRSWLHVSGILITKLNMKITVIVFIIIQVGGLMGLCLGFSLLSFIELIYRVTYRVARNARTPI